MQKMAAKNKKLILLISMIIVSLSVFGCMTNSSTNEEQYNNGKIEAIDNKENPDFAEGLLPPTNQNILMPYYVQAGDNLAKISKKIYGKASQWKKIADLNKLLDANKIYAGDVIYYQLSNDSKIFAEKYESAPKAKIIVKRGDTLTSISRAVFGKSKDWRVLWKENPHIINPDKIKEGVVIFFRPKALTADIKGYGIPEQPIKTEEMNKNSENIESAVATKDSIKDPNENKIEEKVEVQDGAKQQKNTTLSEEELKAIKAGTSENYTPPDDSSTKREDE